MSKQDLMAGADWLQELRKELQKDSFGIICLAGGDPPSPWMFFEAGALAKSLESGRVCPYLFDLERKSVPPGPLVAF